MVGTDGYLLSTRYDGAGRVSLRSLGNGRQTGYDYYDWTVAGGQGRLERIKTGTAASPKLLQHLRYSYDLLGNVTGIQDYKVTGGIQTQSFSYDERDRLLSAAVTGGSAGQGQYEEGYCSVKVILTRRSHLSILGDGSEPRPHRRGYERCPRST